MASNLPRCINVARVCYDHPDPALCSTAEEICWEGVVVHYDGESGKGGRNRFDITAPCDLDDFCYVETEPIEQYLNTPRVWKALGVPGAVGRFNMLSEEVALAFGAANDGFVSTQPQILYLLASGIDALFYHGNLDLACNTAGNLRWANSMPWKGQPEFASKPLQPWTSGGKKAGSFKEVRIQLQGNSKPSRFSFVTVDGAGHMVPMNKPAIALDLMSRWISGAPVMV